MIILCTAFAAYRKNGGVSTDGSTSLSKVMGALGESYENETGVNVSYNATGSGGGIQAVLEGRCDIRLSSRALKDEEKAKGLKATVLAYNGIAVIVNPENPISELDVATIADIFTGKVTDWKEPGGNEGTVILIRREAGSDTRDGFESVTDTEDKCNYRQELVTTGDVIAAVAGNPNAIGYASAASVKDTVKALSVGGVSPSEKTVKTENGVPTLTVKDTGIGIPREHQDRIFERFYRVDKSHSRETGGTGLGLSIVKHAASLHRASVKLESAVGVGTTVTVSFDGKNKGI